MQLTPTMNPGDRTSMTKLFRIFGVQCPRSFPIGRNAGDLPPVETRFTDLTRITPWDFASMMDAFCNGEYTLLRVIRTAESTGGIAIRGSCMAIGRNGMHGCID